ncbi:MAG: alpha/beta hydrolase [Candidatus Promineifilaceae bacterium]
MPYASVNDIKLYYEVHGTGEPLLLIHGLGSSTKDWELQVPVFSRTYQVVTVDVRGHGRSTKPKGPYSVPQFAADIAAFINQVIAAPVNVVGISMGGMIGLQLAVDYPQLLQKLVVVNAIPALQPTSWRDWVQFWRRMVIIRLLGMRRMGAFLAQQLFPEPHQHELQETIKSRWAENDKHAYLAAYRALVGWSVQDHLPGVTVPTLVIAADQDYWPVSAKEAAFAAMPSARLLVVSNSRHATPVDQPERFNTAVLSFLQENG